MLLRNLDQNQGLCNGTRLVVTKMAKHVIATEIISGKNIGLTVYIPRMSMSSSQSLWPYQYPPKVSKTRETVPDLQKHAANQAEACAKSDSSSSSQHCWGHQTGYLPNLPLNVLITQQHRFLLMHFQSLPRENPHKPLFIQLQLSYTKPSAITLIILKKQNKSNQKPQYCQFNLTITSFFHFSQKKKKDLNTVN